MASSHCAVLQSAVSRVVPSTQLGRVGGPHCSYQSTTATRLLIKQQQRGVWAQGVRGTQVN